MANSSRRTSEAHVDAKPTKGKRRVRIALVVVAFLLVACMIVMVAIPTKFSIIASYAFLTTPSHNVETNVWGSVDFPEEFASQFEAVVVFSVPTGSKLRVPIRKEAGHDPVFSERVSNAGLSPGDRFDTASILRCYEAIGLSAPNDTMNKAATELLRIILGAGEGPKIGAFGGTFYRLVSHKTEWK